MTPRVYRRDSHRYVFAASYLVVVAGAVVLATAVHPAFAAGAVPFLLLAWRTLRIGVVTADDGVTVRNVFRDRHIDWEHVSHFDWGSWWGFPTGGVWLDDGRFVRSFALNPPLEARTGQDPAVPKALAGLNAELAAVRGMRDADPPPPADAANARGQLGFDVD